MSSPPTGLEPDAVRPLEELLYALGDDAFLLGHRDAEWTGLGPILEEDIAFSSMAQDEMGHAVVWYGLLGDLGHPSPDGIAYGREVSAWRNARMFELPRGDYAFSLMRQYLADLGHAVRYDALMLSSRGDVAVAATKLRQEEKYHLIHGRTLIERLARGTAESRLRLQVACDALFGFALGIWEPTEGEDVLVSMGITTSSPTLSAVWLAATAGFLDKCGLQPPAVYEEGTWRATGEPQLGGRSGRHGPELQSILDAMMLLRRDDPEAVW